MTRTPGFWLALGASVVVTVAVVAGLRAVEAPAEARLERLDRARTDDLRAIEEAVAWRREQTGRLPAALDSLGLDETVLTDPETGEGYGYRVLSDSTAELCATFARASEEGADLAFSQSEIGPHEAGPHCFPLAPKRAR